jgi:N-acetylneuraminate synthase
MGAGVVEVHVTLSREMPGPDVAASVTTAELRQLSQGVRWVERMRASPVDKDVAAGEVAELRELFFKSVVARRALVAGTVLRPEHLTAKKPGTGIPAAKMTDLVGARLTRDLAADEMVRESDLMRPT